MDDHGKLRVARSELAVSVPGHVFPSDAFADVTRGPGSFDLVVLRATNEDPAGRCPDSGIGAPGPGSVVRNTSSTRSKLKGVCDGSLR